MLFPLSQLSGEKVYEERPDLTGARRRMLRVQLQELLTMALQLRQT